MMNRVVFDITVRQVLGRRRSLLMALFALVPIGLAILVRFAGDNTDVEEAAAEFLYPLLIIGSLLPLAALVFGTSVLGSEFEDGTAVYLLTKPVERSAIVFPKLLAAWIASGLTMLVTGLVSGYILLAGEGDLRIAVGFTVAAVVGSLVYSALFIMLSIITNRALIIGLVYVFLWEGVVTGLFTGTRYLSIREYTLALGDRLSGTPDALFSAHLGEVTAIVGMAIVVVAATWIAIRQLERWEIGEHA